MPAENDSAYCVAADVLQTRNMQSNTAASQLSGEPNQSSLLAQMLMSSSACDEQNSSSGNLTSGNADEDTVEELVLLRNIFDHCEL